MKGEYREGDALILTDDGTITGHTPVSTEQVAGAAVGVLIPGAAVTGGLVTGGAEHPASTRREVRIIRAESNAGGGRDSFWFLPDMELSPGFIG